MTRSTPTPASIGEQSAHPARLPSEATPFTPSARPAVEIRPLRTMQECATCVDLQREVWGFGDSEVVPATLLHVVDYVGGLAAGAFDAAGEMVGFVFGVSGVRNGELVHWSHMLAVRESTRNHGLGRMLKEYQRATMARLGVTKISWSFDPLMAKNAYFNFDRLGASVVEYVPDMYGTTASPLHLGLPTDRLVVAISTSAVILDRPVARNDQLPILSPFPREGDDIVRPGDREPDAMLLEVPPDILDVIQRAPAAARKWRIAVREHFQWALAHGYDVASVRRELATNREFYVLRKAAAKVP